VKGVFEISGNSRYDDLITERYHFPSQYLSEARQLENDWILYRETRVSGGRMAYIATAFVERIDPDEADPTHYYARIRDYLPFDDAVSYRDKDGRFAERFLRDMARPGDAGRTLRGKSVRTLDDDDFVVIVNQGLSETLHPDNRIRLELDERHIDDATAALLADDFGERRISKHAHARRPASCRRCANQDGWRNADGRRCTDCAASRVRSAADPRATRNREDAYGRAHDLRAGEARQKGRNRGQWP